MRNLLKLIVALWLMAVSAQAEIPTITVPVTNGTPSALTSPTLYVATNSAFNYLGLPVRWHTNFPAKTKILK